MDLMESMFKLGEGVTGGNAVGSYLSARKGLADVNKTTAETTNIQEDARKKAFENETTQRLQKAINDSVDPKTGIPDPEKLKVLGHAYGVSKDVVDYTLQNIEKIWSTAQKTVQAKSQLESQSPGAVQAIQEASTPSGVSWSNQPVNTPKQTSKGVAGPITPEYETKTTEVVGEDGQKHVTTQLVPKTPDVDPFAPTAEQIETSQPSVFTKINELKPKNATTQLGGAGGTTIPTTISGVTDYTIPRATYTTVDEKGNPITKEYTPEELRLNPSLDTYKATERFFRERSGIQDQNITGDEVARKYMQSIYETAYKNNYDPNSPVYPTNPTPEAVDKYNEEVRKWNTNNAQAEAKALKAVNDVKEQVAKGNFDYAGKMIDNAKLTINIGGTDYRAKNEKARDNISSIMLVEPMAEKLETQLGSVKQGDSGSLNLLLPVFARVMAAKLNPGAQISEGNIAESKMSTAVEEGNKLGLSAEAIASLAATYALDVAKGNTRGKNFADYAAEFLKGKASAASTTETVARMKSMLEEADLGVEKYKKANLEGYKGKKPKETPPPTKPEGDSTEDSEFTPKTEWFNKPINTRFKLDPENPNSPMGMVTESKTNDVTGVSKATKVKLEDGSIYNVNEGDPESDEVELTPWHKESPKGPAKGKKGGAKKQGKKVETAAERHKRLFGN